MENTNTLKENSITIQNELEWLSNLIDNRLDYFFTSEPNILFKDIPSPSLEDDHSNLSNFIKKDLEDDFERLLIIGAMASNLFPEVYDRFLIKNKTLDKPYTEFGGHKNSETNYFEPTLRTIVFIKYGSSIEHKIKINNYFNFEHIFKQNKILSIENSSQPKDLLDKTLKLGEEFLLHITSGKPFKPSYNSSFPASRIETPLEWEDLVLEDNSLDEINMIDTWLKNQSSFNENQVMSKKINKGYKALFYGPPGTGKTLSASLIGKKNKQDVYRIDISQVVSKYIGETEKNLGNIFDIAENKNWILFFDEAESLFSKRTTVSDSKDKFANQETAYLLQRVENYNGLILLATNLKPNIDLAFSRRIQSVVNFPIPSIKQREILWKNALNGLIELDENELKEIAKNYEIAGGSIKNVIQYAWLKSKHKNCAISINEILMGIRRELNKDGKSFEK
jgi:AAA+ superfamily predicted ATPase